ncbi:MAG: hypothetical protein A3G33_05100 [Omnitrophica bacterium RIFCSPLOWO2_12_FULL_44_17]|uniref:HTH cro/C1-type domain-containing protein n=1 Tax=Candidatus Danuiimicrobium aquiferis TaxID=1801832 RepID=A0A1G1KXB6_9BACT|nr:MAG: hypothetical protein A3B72_01470 [Omnitrophica bacterium RIFCSPHIGHO2_02_FULL_45_28]OGW89154.1 MAG: hypothetical protein A3E74_06265 [Omnitrophica bacterium RIFCSPHIGHO2_12_FULL_44_12]OGW97533.1 MAG: hypothetical protein A3G33_05100 [Omnitrophica bacterium RIFCSPLOWO2_12_FULL_44_17]OGX02086.1 MAG: hypothetical protein A3J12_06395 [Omnitrophica bacterium RIFCSPLOWO2_02_FULL_44_11]
MKKVKAPFHSDLIKPYTRNPAFREKIRTGVKRLKVISQLVELREKLGVTQTELGKRIGVSQPFIARIENDEASNLSLETLVKIANALNAQLDIQIHINKKAA